LPNELYQSSFPNSGTICGKGKRTANTPEHIKESMGGQLPDYVVSVVQKHELEDGAYRGTKVVNGGRWRKSGVEHDTLEVCDYDFTAQVDVKRAAEIILKMRKYKRKLVHCKAGSERSSMLDVAYIASSCINPATNKNYTIEEAVALLQSKRIQVSLDPIKIERAKEIVATVRELELWLSANKSIDDFKPSIVSKIPPYSHSANLACFWKGHKKAAVTMALTAGVVVTSVASRFVL
jgi:protein-tyrosine phosphatase